MTDPNALGAVDGVMLFIAFFLLMLIILWCLLPFAVFGVKAKIDRAIFEAQKANKQLAEISNRLDALAAGQESRGPFSANP